MKFSCSIVFILAFASVQAQEFSIKQAELAGSTLNLHYDLLDTTKARTYSVYVYSSRDNFATPLTKLSGDMGLEVKPGGNRKISISLADEFGAAFAGDVEFEIRGHVYIPFIRFNSASISGEHRRGVPFLVKWTGGTRQNILNFQLYKGKKLVHTFSNVANASEYKMVIPTSTKPGSDYYFRVSDTKNADQVVISPTFKIKPKIGLAWKILPIVAVGAAIPFLLPDSVDELSNPPSEPSSKN